jgi:hypothetical protein
MEEPVEVVPLAGFDPDGEPEARVMADGSLYLVFDLMPPSWAEDAAEQFDNFDQQLTAVCGTAVHWEDREVFRIDRPAPDTIERVRSFLASYRHES